MTRAGIHPISLTREMGSHEALCEQVQRIEILEAEPHFEVEAEYRRQVGYDALKARLIPLEKSTG